MMDRVIQSRDKVVKYRTYCKGKKTEVDWLCHVEGNVLHGTISCGY